MKESPFLFIGRTDGGFAVFEMVEPFPEEDWGRQRRSGDFVTLSEAEAKMKLLGVQESGGVPKRFKGTVSKTAGVARPT